MIGSWYLTEAIYVAFLQFAGFLLLLLVLEDRIYLPMLLALAWRSIVMALGYLAAHHFLARNKPAMPGFMQRMVFALAAYALIYVAINVVGPMLTGNTVMRAGVAIVEDGMITSQGVGKLAARIFVDALVFCASAAPILYIFDRRRSQQN